MKWATRTSKQWVQCSSVASCAVTRSTFISRTTCTKLRVRGRLARPGASRESCSLRPHSHLATSPTLGDKSTCTDHDLIKEIPMAETLERCDATFSDSRTGSTGVRALDPLRGLRGEEAPTSPDLSP